MHAVFWMTGSKENVDYVLNWLTTRTFYLPFKNKEGNTEQLMQPNVAQLRYGVYGTYEYIFPESYMDMVLTALKFDDCGVKNQGGVRTPIKNILAKAHISTFRKMIGCKKIPKFSKDGNQKILMPILPMEGCRIIPIGIRYDVQDWESSAGQIHERL